MSAQPTLVLADDDERTIVDSSMPTGRLTREPPPNRKGPSIVRWRAWATRWFRCVLLVALGGGLCLGLLTVASEQRRLSVRLQRALDEMQAEGRPLPSVESTASVTSKEVLADPAEEPSPSAVTREELEVEAAGFVIANDHSAALQSYVALAMRFRDRPAFSDFVTVLRGKLACESPPAVESRRCD